MHIGELPIHGHEVVPMGVAIVVPVLLRHGSQSELGAVLARHYYQVTETNPRSEVPELTRTIVYLRVAGLRPLRSGQLGYLIAARGL